MIPTTTSAPPCGSTAAEYSPPAIVTLLSSRSRSQYRLLAEWQTPSGWEDAPSILDYDVYPALRPGLVLRELRGSLVVFDPVFLDSHGLNDSAVPLLLLSNGSRSVEELTTDFAAHFGLDRSLVRGDVRRLLAEMIEKRILVPRAARTGPSGRPPVGSPLSASRSHVGADRRLAGNLGGGTH